MATGLKYGGYPLSLTDIDDPNAQTWLQHMMSLEISPNNQINRLPLAGSVDPGATLLMSAQPELTFATPDLDGLFGAVDILNGGCFSGLFPFQGRADCGTFDADTANEHIVYSAAKGFAWISQIQASIDDNEGAVVTTNYRGLSTDGVAPPFAAASAQQLSTLNNVVPPAFVSLYHVSCPVHDDNHIQGLSSVTVDTNITFASFPACPGAFDTHGSITSRPAELRWRGTKLDEFLNGSTTGGCITNFDTYFQKADPTCGSANGRIPYATPEHVRIRCTSGRFEVVNPSYRGTDDATFELVLHPSGPLVISTGIAIPPPP